MSKEKFIDSHTRFLSNRSLPNYCLSDFFYNGLEWSDGKVVKSDLGTLCVVHFSKEKGKYVWNDESCGNVEKLPFCKLIEAKKELQSQGALDLKKELLLLWEMVFTFNDQYRRGVEDTTIPAEEAKAFIDIVLEMQEFRNSLVPPTIKAELFREAGMFKRCFDFDENRMENDEESEILSEIHLRAARGDSKPFIIEDIDFYENKFRRVKRNCIERLSYYL